MSTGPLTYPSGAASLFSTHARVIKHIITRQEVNAAFEKAWNCTNENEFGVLYHDYEQLKADYEAQTEGKHG